MPRIPRAIIDAMVAHAREDLPAPCRQCGGKLCAAAPEFQHPGYGLLGCRVGQLCQPVHDSGARRFDLHRNAGRRDPALFSSGMIASGSLTSNIAYNSDFYMGLGPGGMERMIVYPALMWLAGFGGHLVTKREI